MTEVCTYEVRASSEQDAEEKFLEDGPTYDAEGTVRFTGVDERTVEVKA